MAKRNTLGLSLSVSDNTMVNVCFKSQQRSYDLSRSSTVSELRQRLANDFCVNVSEVKILLGGSLLDDDMTIEDSGVGLESTLFAIQCKTAPPQPKASTRPAMSAQRLDATKAWAESCTANMGHAGQGDSREATPPTPSDDGYEERMNQYYVYCKLCKDVRAGRLRVRCSVCKDGAVLVNKGPSSWDDVLTPGKLTGTCQNPHPEPCIPAFYFKCEEQHPGAVDGTAVALQHIRANRRSVMCITCEEVVSPVVVFPCDSSHVMCLQCFKKYGQHKLQDRGFVHSSQYGYTLPCPASCPNSLIQEQHHFCIMGQDDYERYKDFAAEECLQADGGIYCPRPECGSGFLLEGEGTARGRVLCPHCKHVFCGKCREESHSGECGQQPAKEFSDPQRAARAQWELQTARTIQETTKACPGCSTRTERDGGCMHMKCARCAEEWCWLCCKPWDRDCQAAHWFG